MFLFTKQLVTEGIEKFQNLIQPLQLNLKIQKIKRQSTTI